MSRPLRPCAVGILSARRRDNSATAAAIFLRARREEYQAQQGGADPFVRNTLIYGVNAARVALTSLDLAARGTCFAFSRLRYSNAASCLRLPIGLSDGMSISVACHFRLECRNRCVRACEMTARSARGEDRTRPEDAISRGETRDLLPLRHILARIRAARPHRRVGQPWRQREMAHGMAEGCMWRRAHTQARRGYTPAAPELRRSSFLPLDRHRFQDGGRPVVRSRHTYRPILRATPPLGGPLLLPRSTPPPPPILTCSSTS